MIHLYRASYLILAPFYIFFGILFSRKIRKFFFSRTSNLKKNLKPTFWLHVSSGEFEHAKPLIRALKNKEPLTKIIVTYSSPSYLKPIMNMAEVDQYSPYPLDLKGPVSALIKKINPKIVLISRTDVWPELVHQLKAKKIPSLVFARMENDKNKFLKKISYPLTYKKLTHISFVSEEDKSNFNKIMAHKSTSVDGDPRFEEVFEKQKCIEIKPVFDKSILLGSVWKEDLKVITKPILELLKEKKLSKVLIAPHEPNESIINYIMQAFAKHDPKLFTDDKDIESQVVVLNKVGVLFSLYPLFSTAFVGGSFRKKVHSVLEPLSFGKSVLLGPHFSNNFEAKHYSKNAGKPVIISNNAYEFSRNLETVLTRSPEQVEKASEFLLSDIADQKGASKLLTDLTLSLAQQQRPD